MCLACRSTTSPASSARDVLAPAGLPEDSRGAQDRRQRVAQLVREHREELLAAPDPFVNFGLGAAPLGDVEERHDGADDFVVADDRMAPVFGVEARAVGAPQHLVVHVRLFAVRMAS